MSFADAHGSGSSSVPAWAARATTTANNATATVATACDSTGATARQYQEGSFNTAYTEQTAADLSTAVIDQDGSDNFAESIQSNTELSVSEQRQIGNDNVSLVWQENGARNDGVAASSAEWRIGGDRAALAASVARRSGSAPQTGACCRR